jgi:ATP-dependent Clp protease ATP-binding subunit ClpC
MAIQGPEELRGFGLEARRAVALAETEARGLRHERVGTEHLLIGLLAVDGCVAANRLHESGANINAIRRKVAEVVPQGKPAAIEFLPRSERAVRAIGRAARFSHADNASTIASEHLLLGVLDVEGTAGQVLRGLGVDVGRLRASLLDPAAAPPVDAVPAADAAGTDPTGEAPAVTPSGPYSPLPATCPGCAAELDDTVTYKVLIAHGSRGPREVIALSCGNCSRLLGAAPFA